MEMFKVRAFPRKSQSPEKAIHVPSDKLEIVYGEELDLSAVATSSEAGAPSVELLPVLEATVVESAVDLSDVPDVNLVEAVISGKVEPTDRANIVFGLPTNGAELAAAGGPERYIQECQLLLRADYPIFALRRLKALDAVCVAADPESALSNLDDRRVKEVFAVDTQMSNILEAILDVGSWELVSSKKHLSVNTFMRLGAGGRLDIKVDGILPRSIQSCCAPLLHVDLFKTWLPGVSGSDPICDLSNFRKLMHLQLLKMPMMAQREAVTLGYGDIYSDDSVMVYLTTIDETGPWNPEAEAAYQEALREAEEKGEGEAFRAAVAATSATNGSGSSGGSGGGGDASSSSAAVDSSESSWASGAPKSHNYSEYTAEVDERSKAKGNLRIKIAGGFLFEIKSPTQTKMSAFIKLDLGLPLIPNWVIDFIMKNLAAQFIPMLNSQAAKFEPPKGKLAHLPETPPFKPIYAEMHRRLNAVNDNSAAA